MLELIEYLSLKIIPYFKIALGLFLFLVQYYVFQRTKSDLQL